MDRRQQKTRKAIFNALQRVWIARGYQESIDEVVKIASSLQDKQVPITVDIYE